MRSCALLLLVAAAGATPIRDDTGNVFPPQALKEQNRWPATVTEDARAELVFPVNIVRLYSDEHTPEAIAPEGWLRAQLDVANRVFRLRDEAMAQYGPGRPAPCLQFKVNKVYDVHEREVSDVLGMEFDTENLTASITQSTNGPRVCRTDDLRTLKVTEGPNVLTVFCVWALKDPVHSANEWGGESNVGFADQPPRGPRRVLTRVSSVLARIGVILCRAEASWMNALAHELGHYFGLFHAWERQGNQERGITNLGEGPQGSVDPDPSLANVMDYDNGDSVSQYFTLSQMDFMYRFARDRASEVLLMERRTGGEAPPPVEAVPAGKFLRTWVDRPEPAGAVTVHARFQVDRLLGKAGVIVCWFSDAQGQMLRDTDGTYRTVNGQVSVAGEWTPKYESAIFEDYAISLPQGQLHLPPGTHTIQVSIGLFSGETLLAVSEPTRFEYAEREAPVVAVREESARISGSTVESGVESENQRWVKIVADLALDNLAGKEVFVEARYHFEDGTPLRDFDNVNRSPEGLAYACHSFVPEGASTSTRFNVWIPEDQLHLAPGAYRLYAVVRVLREGRVLASEPTPVFTAGMAAAPPPTAAAVEFQQVWFTFDAQVGGEPGMLIHCRLVAAGLQDRPVLLVAWLWSSRGERVMDYDGRYASADGQVATTLSITPLYPSALFSDCALFLPYRDFHVPPGIHNLVVTLGAFDPANLQVGAKTDAPSFEVRVP